jgi:transposase InsO family protein
MMASKEKNLVIVHAVTEQHLTPAQAAARYRISRQWVYELLHRYAAGGEAALAPRSRAPKTRPAATPPAVTARITDLRRELTADGRDAGPETIAWHLHREGLHTPATSTIRRILHQAGMITPAPRKRPRRSYIRFEADLPNGCWQADITHWYLHCGQRVEILDFLDDHSRYLLHLHTQTAYTGTDVVTAMNALINQYGPPASTLTDNGMVFTTRLTSHPGSRNGFEKLLQAHHIQQKNGSPAHPQTQGKIERFHQTLKRWLRARPRPHTIDDLQHLLDQFRHWYNTDRPHRALGRRTPEHAYTTADKATPHTSTEPEWRTRTDRIDPHGKVTLRYAGKLRHLGMGRRHIGLPVLMLIRDNHVITSHADTGRIIAEHHLDTTRDYQPPTRARTNEPPEKQ